MNTLFDFAVKPVSKPGAGLEQTVKVQNRTEEPEEDPSKEEVDNDVEAQKWKANSRWETNSATAIQPAQFDNGRHVANNGNGAEATANDQHTEEPYAILETWHEWRADDAGSFKKKDVTSNVSQVGTNSTDERTW